MAEKTPPGTLASRLAPQEAPVPLAGSFLVEKAESYESFFDGEVTVPVNVNGNPMSPVETATGIPLPIVASSKSGRKDQHHSFFYDEMYKYGTPGQRAARKSRLQYVNRAHHMMYHNEIDGTEMPQSESDAYRITVLNCAGYIPAYGVRVTGKDLDIVALTDFQRARLREPGIIRVEKGAAAKVTIGQFLIYHALSQRFDKDHIADVTRFLAIDQKEMKRKESLRAEKERLALRLTNIAISHAVDPINEEFRRSRKATALRKGTPPTPWHVVKQQIEGREADYYETLETRLAGYALVA